MSIDPAVARQLPKVELHCHVEGSARPTTIAELARKNGVALPVDDPRQLFTFSNLNQFLEIYIIVCSSLRDADDYRRITYEALEDAAAAGVRYREMFFSPGFGIGLGVPVDVIWAGIRQGVLDGTADFDVACRMILDVDKPSGAQQAVELVTFAATQDRDLLIGVGGDSVERDVDHRQFAEAFRLAEREGLRRTMHAGEDGPAENIRVAVDELGCERIDHGYRLLDDAALTSELVERRVPVTSCPSSNRLIARLLDDLADHPFRAMRERGVLVTLNSDDPGMMQMDLGDEYAAVADAYDYGLADLGAISLAGIESCWAPADEKAALDARFRRELAELGAGP
jgi:adenosine deaminase